MPIDLPPAPPAIVITDNGGGVVGLFQNQVDQYTRENREVRIMGSCRSACILFLGVPKVCVGPNAVIKAHEAYEPASGRIRPDITEDMLRNIPPRISARLSPYITVNYNTMSTLNASQLNELGIPMCQDNNTITASDKPKPKREKTFVVGKPIPGDPITKFLFDTLGVK